MALLNRCINCTITFDNPRIVSRGVLALDSPLRDILLAWISPMEVISEHRICEECIVVLQSQAQMNAPIRDYGHKAVCLGCGVSVLQARSVHIDRNRQEYTIIQSWVPQIQQDLPIFSKVCKPCWTRVTRARAQSLESQNAEPGLPDVNMEMEGIVEMTPHASIGVQVVENPSRPPTPPALPMFLPVQDVVRSQ